MTDDMRSWQIRLFIIMLIGGLIAYLSESMLFGSLYGAFVRDGGAASVHMSLLMSMGLSAVNGFFLEALPVAFIGRPKNSPVATLNTHWASGYLLAWLAMWAVLLLMQAGLRLLLPVPGADAAMMRWTGMGLAAIAAIAAAFTFIFMLTQRFAGQDWPADWHIAALVLAGGQIGIIILFQLGVSMLGASLLFGFLGPVLQAVLAAIVLGLWRRSLERSAPPRGGMVF